MFELTFSSNSLIWFPKTVISFFTLIVTKSPLTIPEWEISPPVPPFSDSLINYFKIFKVVFKYSSNWVLSS